MEINSHSRNLIMALSNGDELLDKRAIERDKETWDLIQRVLGQCHGISFIQDKIRAYFKLLQENANLKVIIAKQELKMQSLESELRSAQSQLPEHDPLDGPMIKMFRDW